MNHPTIIGLTGPAGSGKDTVADLLVFHAGFTKLAFADPLRNEVADAFDIDPLYLTRRETKEHPMSCLALRRCQDAGFVERMRVVQALAGRVLDLDAPCSPRQIMQWWGTDYRRHQHIGYWVNQMRNRISYQLRQGLSRRIVVTDCRFADEIDMVRSSFAGQLWNVQRDGVGVAAGSHASETTGLEFRPDLTLDNSHSIEHLQERALEAYWAHSARLPVGSLRVRIGKSCQQAA